MRMLNKTFSFGLCISVLFKISSEIRNSESKLVMYMSLILDFLVSC